MNICFRIILYNRFDILLCSEFYNVYIPVLVPMSHECCDFRCSKSICSLNLIFCSLKLIVTCGWTTIAITLRKRSLARATGGAGGVSVSTSRRSSSPTSSARGRAVIGSERAHWPTGRAFVGRRVSTQILYIRVLYSYSISYEQNLLRQSSGLALSPDHSSFFFLFVSFLFLLPGSSHSL